MAILKLYATKDSYITNFERNNIPQTGSNFGYAQSLKVFRIAPLSGTAVTGSVSRILTKFDLSAIDTLVAAGKVAYADIQYFLRMKNLQHSNTLPESYDLEIERVTSDWDEGRGVDVAEYSDKGFANWEKRKSNAYWTTTGSDYTGSLITNYHFDQGDEDLEANVTDIVGSWLTGSFTNNGFIVHLSSTLETGTSDYYYKAFYARNTHFPDNRPCLEARWNNSLRDDRNNFKFGVTGSLFLYNSVNGQLTNLLTTSPTITIADASGTITWITGSFTGITGIYSATFAIATGTYSGSLFTDVWKSGSTTLLSSNFGIGGNFASSYLNASNYFVSIVNLKNTYELSDYAKLRLFVKRNDFSPSIVATASNNVNGIVISKAYYKILNDKTQETVIHFGTGSLESTRMSYDVNGNYFDLNFSSFSQGNVYRIELLFDNDGEMQVLDKSWKFRVV